MNDDYIFSSNNNDNDDPSHVVLQKTAFGLLDRFLCCASTSFQVYDGEDDFVVSSSSSPGNNISTRMVHQNSFLEASSTTGGMVSPGLVTSPRGRNPRSSSNSTFCGGRSSRSFDQQQQLMSVTPEPQPHHQQQSGFIFLDGSQTNSSSRRHEQQVFAALERNRSYQTATTASVSSGTSSVPIPSIQSSQTFDDNDDDDESFSRVTTCSSVATRAHSNVSSSIVMSSPSSCSSSRCGITKTTSLSALRIAKQRAREYRDEQMNHTMRKQILPELAVLHKKEGYQC